MRIIINEHLIQPRPKSFLRILYMVTERCKLSLSFGVRGWSNISLSLDMSGDHTYSFHIAWRKPCGIAKGDIPQGETEWGVKESPGDSLSLQQSQTIQLI